MIKKSVIITLVLITLTFAYFKAHDLLLGVKISIDTPTNGETLNEQFITIKGKAPGNTLLTINGAKVLTDVKGSFQKELLLGLGYNMIEIKALDRFNREKKEVLELVYRPSLEDNHISVKWSR
ncbi:MAG: hypothetical protein AAB590_01260 [Patescibacteria group bacterium]